VSEYIALLASAGAGSEAANTSAFTLLYDELKRLAHAKLRRHQTMTLLDTTSLVHESFLKLAGSDALSLGDRRHFFAYAARVMRSVIVDFARARQAQRRGGDAEWVTLDTAAAHTLAAPHSDVLRVHEALEVLADADPRLAQVVELRYFGGLTEVEVADVLAVTERTVRRDWHKAKLLLAAALDGPA
jgi:RNA polymerase sigma factor (TIGR02999 family)